MWLNLLNNFEINRKNYDQLEYFNKLCKIGQNHKIPPGHWHSANIEIKNSYNKINQINQKLGIIEFKTKHREWWK